MSKNSFIPDKRDRDISLLETYNVVTGEREVLHVFDHLIEAPNWIKDGKALIYNSRGCIWRYDLATGESTRIDTGFAVNCNNDQDSTGFWFYLDPNNDRIMVTGWKKILVTTDIR